MKPKPTISSILTGFLLITIVCMFSAHKDLKQPISYPLQQSRLYLDSKSVPPYTIEAQVLGSLVGIDRIIKRANLTPYTELNRIIWFESSNDPTAKNSNSSAEGYCQIIKSTREAIEKEIGKIDWENPDEQLKACIWLYENGIPENEWKETEHLWKQ